MMIKKFYLILAACFLATRPAWAYQQQMAHSASHPMFRGMHAKQPALSHQPIAVSQETPAFIAIIPVEEIVQLSDIKPSDDPFYKIEKKYKKIIHKIACSNLSQELRSLLLNQAKENKNLAIKQTQEKMKLCIKHSYELSPYRCEFYNNKEARKLLKKIKKL